MRGRRSWLLLLDPPAWCGSSPGPGLCWRERESTGRTPPVKTLARAWCLQLKRVYGRTRFLSNLFDLNCKQRCSITSFELKTSGGEGLASCHQFTDKSHFSQGVSCSDSCCEACGALWKQEKSSVVASW